MLHLHVARDIVSGSIGVPLAAKVFRIPPVILIGHCAFWRITAGE